LELTAAKVRFQPKRANNRCPSVTKAALRHDVNEKIRCGTKLGVATHS